MDITLDKKNSTEGLIKVKLKQKDYQPNVEEKVKEYAKKATIKGFRPGKVPTGLIRKMYGKSIVVEEVNNLLSQSLSEYIKTNDLKIIGEPIPDMEKAKDVDWENQEDFEFDYSIGLIDDFKYDLSDSQKVKAYDIELDKKTFEETLDNVKKQFGDVTNPEVSKEGDSFYGTFEQIDGDLSNESLLAWENINKKEQKKFVGIKPGDVVEFDIEKLTEDNHQLMSLLDIGHDLAHDTKGKFKFTIKNINRTEPAELGQELFDKVFGKDVVKSEDEFTEKVKKTVQDNYDRETAYMLDRDIKDHFIDKTKIEIPKDFLKKWLMMTNENITENQVEAEFDEYVKSLKWDLIKNRIGEDNDIKIENDEITNKAKSLILQQLGGAGAAEQLKDHLNDFADNYLKAENGQNYMKIFNEVRDEKILELIKQKIKITHKKVSLDEFKKLAAN